MHTKRGVGLALDQTLPHDLRAFARISWADGQTETYAFTEIDRSFSTGLLVQGKRWARAQDSVGLAWGHNALSAERRDFLAAGGISFFLGDDLALFAFLLAAVGVLAVVAMILHLPADGWLAAEEAR